MFCWPQVPLSADHRIAGHTHTYLSDWGVGEGDPTFQREAFGRTRMGCVSFSCVVHWTITSDYGTSKTW